VLMKRLVGWLTRLNQVRRQGRTLEAELQLFTRLNLVVARLGSPVSWGTGRGPAG
jgi:hypothetical protein